MSARRLSAHLRPLIDLNHRGAYLKTARSQSARGLCSLPSDGEMAALRSQWRMTIRSSGSAQHRSATRPRATRHSTTWPRTMQISQNMQILLDMWEQVVYNHPQVGESGAKWGKMTRSSEFTSKK